MPTTKPRHAAALAVATLLLTFAAAPLPAHAADPITLDDPGAMPLEFAVGANTLDLVGTLDDLADNVVVLLMDGAKNSFSPACGPVAPEPDGTWSCTTDPLPDHIGFLVAVAEIGEHTAEYPYQGITAPTLDPASAGLTSENPTPTFTGTVPEGGVTSTVTVTVDGAVGCTTTVRSRRPPGPCDIPDGVMATLNHVYVIEVTQTKEFDGALLLDSSATSTTYTLLAPPVVIPLPVINIPDPAAPPPPPRIPTSGMTLDLSALNTGTTPTVKVDPAVGALAVSLGTSLCGEQGFKEQDLHQDTGSRLAVVGCDSGSVEFTGGEDVAIEIGAVQAQLIVNTFAPPDPADLFPRMHISVLFHVGPWPSPTVRALAPPRGVTRVAADDDLILLASEPFTGEPMTLSGTIPADVAAGEHGVALRLTLDEQPDTEPLDLRMPIVVAEPAAAVDDEPQAAPATSTEPDAPWWPWLVAGVLVVAAIAAAVVVVRRFSAR